jgi:tetratricopeptide (TPR) repeat protein
MPTQGQLHQLMMMASRHFGNGELQQAAALCRRVLEVRPNFGAAQHLLGVCYLKGGDAHTARTFLLRANALSPEDAQLNHHLGIVLSELGDREGAERAFTNAARLKPNDPEILYNLAVTSADLHDSGAAQAAYRRVLAIAPRHAQAAAALASLCESENKLKEAQTWAATALRSDHANPVAHLTRAKLDFRAGRYDDARQRLEQQMERALTPRNQALTAGQLGLAYDRLQRYDKAFNAFRAAKQHLAGLAAPIPADGIYGRQTLMRIAHSFERLAGTTERLTKSPVVERTPVFLVGFPRSGTTLLDQILSSHSEVTVLEEKDTLHDFLHRFATTDAGLTELVHGDPRQLAPYRERYWAEVSRFIQLDNTKLFIDKLPLNTAFMPLILSLFPEARFIFALRDPRDVALSCFMQVFDLTQAMTHFLSLDGVADFYDLVMRVGIRSLECFPARVHLIRYEDLIVDMEAEVRRLVAFLNLSWEPELMHYDRTARSHRINTPSYHQVVQPIYTSARGRWRNYAQHLESIMPRLHPFVEYFGYV